jgi:hypothetical protein
MDNSYGPGVGLTAGLSNKRKASERKPEDTNQKKNKACKCGSTTLQQSTHSECPMQRAPNPQQPKQQQVAATALNHPPMVQQPSTTAITPVAATAPNHPPTVQQTSTAAVTQLAATNALHQQPLTTQQLPPRTSTILHHPPMAQQPSTTTVPIVAAPNHPPTVQQTSTAAITQLSTTNTLLQQPLTTQQLPPTTLIILHHQPLAMQQSPTTTILIVTTTNALHNEPITTVGAPTTNEANTNFTAASSSYTKRKNCKKRDTSGTSGMTGESDTPLKIAHDDRGIVISKFHSDVRCHIKPDNTLHNI